MTLLHDAVNEKKFDTRVVERNVARGQVRPEDREKALKDLPDDAANADIMNVEALIQEHQASS